MIICSLISWWKLEEQQKHVVDVRHGYVSHNVTETQRVSKSNSVEVALILLMEEILHLLILVNIPLFTGFYTSQVVVWDFFHRIILPIYLG